jgi:MHS family proline/betaine transporter-like MFS transporter
MQMKLPWKIVFCGFIGNVLEAYDFLLFGIFAGIIAKTFMPPSDNDLLMTLAIFASGFVMRPIGGLVMGSIGDHFGRKKALYLSAALMSLSTIFMGSLPSYEYWGILSTILLILCRLLQGFSVGGEYSGALIFVIEHTPKKHAALAGSLITTSSFFGAFLATGVAYLVTRPFMPEWGWRVAFWLGIFMGILSFYIRLKLLDTPHFLAFLKDKSKETLSLSKMVRTYAPNLLATIGIGALNGLLGYTFFTYLNIYFKNVLNIPATLALQYNTFGLIVFLLSLPIIGWIADKLSPLRVMTIGAACVFLFAFPFYILLNAAQPLYVMMIILVFGLSSSAFIGPSNAVMNDLFPVAVRYRGVSIGFNLGMTIFGGTAPAINTYLIGNTGSLTAPSLYIVLCGLIGFVATLKAKKLIVRG